MGVPSRLQSVAEVVENCRWWKLVRTKLPYRYHGTQYTTQYECTRSTWCEYNVSDPRIGGCIIAGNVAKIPKEKRP